MNILNQFVNEAEDYTNCNGIIKVSKKYIDSQLNFNSTGYTYKTLVKTIDLINTGNIDPEGDIVETPTRLTIELKQHQKRRIVSTCQIKHLL